MSTVFYSVANNVGPYQMPQYVASDMGLHYLPMILLRVSWLEWVKGKSTSRYIVVLSSARTVPLSFTGRLSMSLLWIHQGHCISMGGNPPPSFFLSRNPS